MKAERENYRKIPQLALDENRTCSAIMCYDEEEVSAKGYQGGNSYNPNWNTHQPYGWDDSDTRNTLEIGITKIEDQQNELEKRLEKLQSYFASHMNSVDEELAKERFNDRGNTGSIDHSISVTPHPFPCDETDKQCSEDNGIKLEDFNLHDFKSKIFLIYSSNPRDLNLNLNHI